MIGRVRGLQPHGPPSWSTVNLLLPIQVGDRDSATPMFALTHWALPRVPTIGEEIDIDAIGSRVRIESVRWDIQGRAVVRLEETPVQAEALEALERDGWTVAPWEDEPPRGWLDS
jgi:hypothetical protein